MDDLINRQYAIKTLLTEGLITAAVYIERMPTADLSEYSDKLWEIAYKRGKADAEPEIIRCKDCRWWRNPDGCNHWDGMVTSTANGFCSYAERWNVG